MSGNFTAEDFARANFATRGEFEVARRVDPDDALAWRACQDDGREVFLTDDGMSRDGWVPVVESRVMEHTLWDLQAAAERKRQRLLDHIADQDRVIRRRNKEINELRALRDELRERCASLEDDYASLLEDRPPITLDDLAAAWEAAEQTDECREGDVLIASTRDGYSVYRATHHAQSLALTVRVLSRAPQREPWQDLADVLGDFAIHDHDGKEYPDVLAQRLYERGVRVTGGDES